MGCAGKTTAVRTLYLYRYISLQTPEEGRKKHGSLRARREQSFAISHPQYTPALHRGRYIHVVFSNCAYFPRTSPSITSIPPRSREGDRGTCLIRYICAYAPPVGSPKCQGVIRPWGRKRGTRYHEYRSGQIDILSHVAEHVVDSRVRISTITAVYQCRCKYLT